jgi:hypothetical protein
MKRGFFLLFSQFNNSLYNIFSAFPFYVGKTAIGIIYALILTMFLYLCGRNFIKMLIFSMMIIFLLKFLNVITINSEIIESFFGIPENLNFSIIVKEVFSSYTIECISFIFFFFAFSSIMKI